MGNSYEIPANLEFLNILLFFTLCLCPLSPSDGSFRLSCGGKFNYVRDEEVARDEEVEDGSVYDILSAIIMATNTY